ncbi:MAG: hypothetical protein PVG22_13130 [Chromatiales bacterium]|jgi:hypothetical protein
MSNKCLELLSTLISACFLVACTSVPEKQTVIVEKTVYPELPPISHPPALQLTACEWQKPVRMDELVLVNGKTYRGKKCSEYTDDERRAITGFETNCMEHPLDTQSNIVFGFDEDGWNCFRVNMTAIRTLLEQYKFRLDMVNKQRAEWIEKNTAEKEKKQGEEQ